MSGFGDFSDFASVDKKVSIPSSLFHVSPCRQSSFNFKQGDFGGASEGDFGDFGDFEGASSSFVQSQDQVEHQHEQQQQQQHTPEAALPPHGGEHHQDGALAMGGAEPQDQFEDFVTVDGKGNGNGSSGSDFGFKDDDDFGDFSTPAHPPAEITPPPPVSGDHQDQRHQDHGVAAPVLAAFVAEHHAETSDNSLALAPHEEVSASHQESAASSSFSDFSQVTEPPRQEDHPDLQQQDASFGDFSISAQQGDQTHHDVSFSDFTSTGEAHHDDSSFPPESSSFGTFSTAEPANQQPVELVYASTQASAALEEGEPVEHVGFHDQPPAPLPDVTENTPDITAAPYEPNADVGTFDTSSQAVGHEHFGEVESPNLAQQPIDDLQNAHEGVSAFEPPPVTSTGSHEPNDDDFGGFSAPPQAEADFQHHHPEFVASVPGDQEEQGHVDIGLAPVDPVGFAPIQVVDDASHSPPVESQAVHDDFGGFQASSTSPQEQNDDDFGGFSAPPPAEVDTQHHPEFDASVPSEEEAQGHVDIGFAQADATGFPPTEVADDSGYLPPVESQQSPDAFGGFQASSEFGDFGAGDNTADTAHGFSAPPVAPVEVAHPADEFGGFSAPPPADHHEADDEFGDFDGPAAVLPVTDSHEAPADDFGGFNSFTAAPPAAVEAESSMPASVTLTSDFGGNFGAPASQPIAANFTFAADESTPSPLPAATEEDNAFGGFSAPPQAIFELEQQQPAVADDFGDFGGPSVIAEEPPAASAPASSDDFGGFGDFPAPPAITSTVTSIPTTGDDFGDFGASASNAAPTSDGFGDFGTFDSVPQPAAIQPAPSSSANEGGDFGDFGNFGAPTPSAGTTAEDNFGDFGSQPQPTSDGFGAFGDFRESAPVGKDDFGFTDSTSSFAPSTPSTATTTFQPEALKLNPAGIRTALSTTLGSLFPQQNAVASSYADEGAKLEALLNESSAWMVYAQTQLQSFAWNTTQIEASLMNIFGVKASEKPRVSVSTGAGGLSSRLSQAEVANVPSPVRSTTPAQAQTFMVDTGFGQMEVAPSRETFSGLDGQDADLLFTPATSSTPTPVASKPASAAPAAAATSQFGSDFDMFSFEADPRSSHPATAAPPVAAAQPLAAYSLPPSAKDVCDPSFLFGVFGFNLFTHFDRTLMTTFSRATRQRHPPPLLQFRLSPLLLLDSRLPASRVHLRLFLRHQPVRRLPALQLDSS